MLQLLIIYYIVAMMFAYERRRIALVIHDSGDCANSPGKDQHLTTQPALVSRCAPSSGIRYARVARFAHPHAPACEPSNTRARLCGGRTSQAGNVRRKIFLGLV